MSARVFCTTVLPSAARTGDTDGPDLPNNECAGIHVIVDVSAIVAGASIFVFLEGKCPASGKYYPLLEGTEGGVTFLKLSETKTDVLKLDKGLPQTWRVRVQHLNSNSITYSIGAHLLP